MIYNSRDPKHKSIYGALEAGQEMTVRLLLPYDSGAVCYSARMLVTEDSTGEETAYELVGTNSYEDGNRWWELTLSLEEPGLYWYYFEYNTPWSQEQVYKGAYSNGYIRIDPSYWQLTVYEKGYRTPDSLKGSTMYQIFPDRFFDSRIPKYHVPADRDMVTWFSEPRWRPDEHGRVWNNDYFGGDLKGIERKLPYIRNLGVTVIYLNPIFESHTNHRYSTADYSKIDPLLGTEEDFRELCIQAHKFGIKIILDGVFSHTGDDSVYFNKKGRYPTLGAYNSKESPYYPWYNFSEWPDHYDSWWGFDILPNVNETNPQYMEYITGEGGIIEKWLKLGADGWRLDVADELPDEFIEAIHTRAKATKKDAIVLDTAGLKREICEKCFPMAHKYGFTFVGGHPMAGKKYSGFKYSSGKLFRDASMIVVPEQEDDQLLLSNIRAALAPCDFGRITVCTPEKHDEMIAFTSELAHIVSNAYIKSPSAMEHRGYSAGSYRDLTRVAWLNEDMWTGIFMKNRDNLIKELDYIIKFLGEYREALDKEDSDRLWRLLHDGKMAKENVDGK